MIFAKLNADGSLTDIRQGPQQPGGVWPDGSQDVPLTAMPSSPPGTPYSYNAATETAVAQPIPPVQQLDAIEGRLTAALAFRASASWAGATAKQQAAAMAIIDAAGSRVAGILPK